MTEKQGERAIFLLAECGWENPERLKFSDTHGVAVTKSGSDERREFWEFHEVIEEVCR